MKACLGQCNKESLTPCQTIAKEKKRFLKAHLGPKSLDTYCQIVAFMSDKAKDVVSDTAWDFMRPEPFMNRLRAQPIPLWSGMPDGPLWPIV